MIKRVTKAHKVKVIEIYNSSGYWCKDMKNFLDQFDTVSYRKIEDYLGKYKRYGVQ